MYEGTASNQGPKAPATIGTELRELEMLADKLGAALSPVLAPRVLPADKESPVENPGYLRRLKAIRHRLLDLMNALEL